MDGREARPKVSRLWAGLWPPTPPAPLQVHMLACMHGYVTRKNRLCGSVLCDKCSVALDADAAGACCVLDQIMSS